MPTQYLVTSMKVFDAEIINATATVDSLIMHVGDIAQLGQFLKMTGSAPDIKLYYRLHPTPRNPADGPPTGGDSDWSDWELIDQYTGVKDPAIVDALLAPFQRMGSILTFHVKRCLLDKMIFDSIMIF